MARKLIDADEVRNMLRIAAKVEGSQKKLAERLHLDTGYLSHLLNDNYPIAHESVLEFLGLERVEMFRRKDGGLL